MKDSKLFNQIDVVRFKQNMVLYSFDISLLLEKEMHSPSSPFFVPILSGILLCNFAKENTTLSVLAHGPGL